MVETQTQDETQEAQGEVIVRVDNLTKVFRDFWGRPKARAVNGVSFEVHAGEVFGFRYVSAGCPHLDYPCQGGIGVSQEG